MYYFLSVYFFFTLIPTECHWIMVGDRKIEIIKQIGQGKTFIHLHENEVTAFQAAKAFINLEGGSLISLRHSGERNISFCLKNKRYEFDPNRIFTDKGIKETLRQFGPYSKKAHQEVKKLATTLISLLPNNKIVAVHNNHSNSYSFKTYFPSHSLAREVEAIAYWPKNNFRNFYFVTNLKEYERLKKLKFNVALQAAHATDDGSLSYYLGKKNYVNVESGYDQLVEQIKMLYWA